MKLLRSQPDQEEDVNLDIVLDRLELLKYKDWILNHKSQTKIYNGKVVRLDLSWLGITYLPANFLNELQYLRDIRLDNNRDCAYEKGALANLPNLESVKLQYCKLKTIPSQIFGDISPLKIMDLSFNPIKKVKSGDFQSLSMLRELKLDHTEISKITKQCFLGLKTLESLALDNNQISSIHPTAFNDLQQLKILDLHNNNLTQLAPDLFNHTRHLEELILDSNNLSELSTGIFSPLQRLRNLSIFNNQLESIGRELSNLSSLGKICLDTNLITDLEKDAFQKTHSLKVIELQSNLIREIEKDTFINNTQLEILNIQNNPLDFTSALELPECAMFDYIPFISNLTKEELHEIIIEHFSNRRLVDQAISLNLLSNETLAFLRLTDYYDF